MSDGLDLREAERVAMPAGDAAPPDPATRQRQAADPTASVWVGASAGTGKTKVLIDRMLRLMLGGTPPERILCLTFTKAAAAEMENRLASRLALWSTLPDEALTRDIADLTGETPVDAQLASARRLFAQVLDTPGGLRIDTIHAFCQSVLRRFPVEAKLAPDFDLIDEQEAAALQEAARRDLLASADPEIRAAVARIAAVTDEDGFGGIMATIVAERGRIAALLAQHRGLEGLVAALRSYLDIPHGETERAAIARFCDEASFDAASLRRVIEVMNCGSKADGEKAACIAAFLAATPEERAALLATYRGAFLTGTGEPRAKLATKKVFDLLPEAEAMLSAEVDRLILHEDVCRRIRTAEATEALLVIGEAFLRHYAAEKARRGALDFGDLIARTAALLNEHGEAWVLYKLDGGIDHVLVDEAQDTNPEQWDVILRLIEEFTAGESAREEPRTLFVVGDEKQSIFSFQGADREAFGRSRQIVQARHAAAGKPFRAVPLETSFRSVDAVLSVVDAVFADEAALRGVADAPPRHLVSEARREDGGRVELWAPLQVDPGDPEPPWEPPTLQRGPTSAAVALAERVARMIRRWIDDREPLPSKGRPISAGDVLILVRTRNQLFREIVRWLKRLAIPVAGADRMVLTEQLAVMDLLALGRFLLLPEDDLSLAEVLKGPFIGFDDDRLFALAHGREGTLWSALARAAQGDTPDAAACDAARDWLAGLLARADRVPPFELFAGMLAAPCPADPVSGRRAIARRLGPEAEDPVDALLEQMIAFGSRHPPSLQRFIAWITAGKAEAKRQPEAGAGLVRVMTVHGAKGLQAPIVILPDTISMPKKAPSRAGDKILWPDDELPVPLWAPRSSDACGAYELARSMRHERAMEEYRRLLYVALTRAEDRLVICGHLGKHDRTAECWHALCEAGLRRLTARREDVDPATAPLYVHETPQRRSVVPLAIVDPAAPDIAAPDWLSRPAAPEPRPMRPLTPSRPAEAELPTRSPLLAVEPDRFRRGALIHALLQYLPGLAPAARQAAAAAWAARQGLAAEAAAEIVATTLAVLESPALAPYFGPGSRAEVPVTGVFGDQVLAGQIDRVAILPDAVLALDFKTNRPAPATLDAVAPAYLAQMATYRAALRAIFPDRPVRCALLWTEGPRLMALPDELLDRHAPGIMARS